MNLKYIVFLLILGFAFASCKSDPKPVVDSKPKVRAKVPSFDADSAYVYLEKQLEFGFRVPGTAEHEACKDWLVQKLESFGMEVWVQQFKTQIYTCLL